VGQAGSVVFLRCLLGQAAALLQSVVDSQGPDHQDDHQQENDEKG